MKKMLISNLATDKQRRFALKFDALYFLIVCLLTILVTRTLCYVFPTSTTAEVSIISFDLHHLVIGFVLIFIALMILLFKKSCGAHCRLDTLTISAIGMGLILDEFSMLTTNYGDVGNYWSGSSFLIAIFVFAIVVVVVLIAKGE